MNTLSIAVVLLVTGIIFYPLFTSKNKLDNNEINSEKDNLLEILRNIELEYELGNIDKETYLRSKSDYASKLKIILDKEKDA